MYNLTENEKTFILEKFNSVENFKSFFTDMILLELQLKGETVIDVDLTPYTTDDMVTGIVTSVKLEGDSLKLDMLVRGSHRTLETTEDCAKIFLRARDSILSDRDDCSLSMEDINNFKFAQNKPFLLDVEESVVFAIKPLDISWYDEYWDLFEKLTDEE